MSQLLPHPELGPPLHPNLSPEQRIAAWIDLMRFSDRCFEAGARHRLKPGEDLLDAVRASYARYMEDKDKKLLTMARRFAKCNGD